MKFQAGSFSTILLCLLGLGGSAFAQMRVLDTQHYRIHSDLDTRLTEDLGERMDAMFEQYAARLSSFSPPKDKRFEVYLFSKKRDYLTLTNEAISNSGGIFIAQRQLLAAFLEGQGRDALRRALQHEAFHQFAFTAIGPNLPLWLNEGMAQIFEEGIWTGQGFDINQVPPRRVRQLQLDIRDRRLIPFENFVSLTSEQWRRGMANAASGAAEYSQAWAMTHFLIFARDDDDAPKYRSRLISLLKLIHDKPTVTDPFPKAFSDNYDGFQQRFLEYVRTLQATRDAVSIERQSVLADILMQLYSQRLHYEDIDDFRTAVVDNGYRLRYSKGQLQWQSESDPAVYFRDDQGRTMTKQQLYLSPRGGAPIPDIVYRPSSGLKLRTIFHDDPGRIDHETIVEGK